MPGFWSILTIMGNYLKNITFWASLIIFALLAGCAGTQSALYDTPSLSITKEDSDLFAKAFRTQKLNKYGYASKLWQEFLVNNPNSYQAHNNLGVIYFHEDQLNHSIQEFETAYAQSPRDENKKVGKNLISALKLKTILLKENREYVRGRKHLVRLHGLVPNEEKEKVRAMIEDFDNRIFEKVMGENSVEAYERYLENYPKGYNVIEAKERLIELKERPGAPMSFNTDPPAPAKLEGVLDLPANESWVEEEAPVVQKAPPIKPRPTVLTPSLSSVKSGQGNQSLAKLNPAPPVEARKAARKRPQMENSARVSLNSKIGAIIPRGDGIGHQPSSEDGLVSLFYLEDKGPGNAVTLETEAEETQSQLVKVQLVKVVVKDNQLLKVLDQPSIKSKIVGQLENNDVCVLLNEIEGWFQVKYTGENTGWISQQFSEKIN